MNVQLAGERTNGQAAPATGQQSVKRPPIPPALAAVTSSIKTDPQPERIQSAALLAHFTADGKKTTVDVLQILYAKPQAADYVQQLSKAMGKLSAAEGMKVGQALNELGVYPPNLKPGLARRGGHQRRIKKVYMGGYNIYDSSQGKYIQTPVRMTM